MIKDVALIAPTVIWPQNESGEWRVPMAERPSEAQTQAEEEPTVSAPENLPEGTPPQKESKKTKPVVVESTPAGPQIKRIRLSDGSFHFLDHEKRNIALFDGVQFSSSMRDVTTIRGQVRIDKIVLRDRVFLSALRSPIRYDPSELELSGISAEIAKGQLTGDFSMEPQAEDSPFTVHASFRRVQADELVAEAGGSRDMIRGVLEGTLDATGKTADPEALTGSGTILLQNGHVQQFAVLAALGQLLQIEELMQLDLEQAEAKYRLAGNTVLVDELLLRSPNLRLTATGSVSLRGKLALDSVLAINEKIRSQLFRGIRENFVPTSEPGEYALQFHVGGTVDKPKTDLMERAVGADLKDLGGVIDALLGHGKAKKEKCRVNHTVGPAQAVRVIAGTAGGLQLKVPRTGVRPTMDRVKAAIFSSLGEKVIGARVLDLFAGAGGLGIEAMSRGAASAVFVESNRNAARIVERNLAIAGLDGRVRMRDAFAYLKDAAETV